MAAETKALTKLDAAKMSILGVLNKPQTQEMLRSALQGMGITPERVVTVAFTTIAGKEKLLECSARSLVKVIVEGSLLGLSFDPHLKQAYIVPFAGEATLIIGYMGLVKLARQGGILSYVDAHCVYEKDAFDFALGLEPYLTHKPPAQGPRGKMTGVYAVGILTDGTKVFRYLSAEDVEFYRLKSPARDKSDSPWNSDIQSMWRKTAIRRLIGYMPMDEKTSRAVYNDELAETGHPQLLAPEVFSADFDMPTEPKVSKTEERKAQMQAEKADKPAPKEEKTATAAEAKPDVPTSSADAEPPEVDPARTKALGAIKTALGTLFSSQSVRDINVSEATGGKFQSFAALDEAPTETLTAVYQFLTAKAAAS